MDKVEHLDRKLAAAGVRKSRWEIRRGLCRRRPYMALAIERNAATARWRRKYGAAICSEMGVPPTRSGPWNLERAGSDIEVRLTKESLQ